MLDNRRIRFATIEGLERSDLALAGEIWLDDLFRAAWMTREALKLAVLLVRAMAREKGTALTFREIEMQAGLNIEEVRKALILMRSMGAADAFICERDDLKIALNLGILQRLRALEARERFRLLMGPTATEAAPPWAGKGEKWHPLQGSPAAQAQATPQAA